MDTPLEQALELMALGMGFVLSFLMLLVLVTTLMSWFINRFFPEAALVPSPAPLTNQPEAASEPFSVTTLAAIQEAIRQHRARQH